MQMKWAGYIIISVENTVTFYSVGMYIYIYINILMKKNMYKMISMLITKKISSY